MTTALRSFLLLEVIIFACASLLHRGLMLRGFEHLKAAIAESVIGLVLAVGFAIGVYRPLHARAAALTTQSLALLGVAVGVATIIIGIGPRTVLDYLIQAVMAVVLVGGLLVARSQGPRISPT